MLLEEKPCLHAQCAGESRCRQYEESSCKYGGHCNFMHIKRPAKDVCKRLGIRTTYEAARGGGGSGGGGGGGGCVHGWSNPCGGAC